MWRHGLHDGQLSFGSGLHTHENSSACCPLALQMAPDCIWLSLQARAFVLREGRSVSSLCSVYRNPCRNDSLCHDGLAGDPTRAGIASPMHPACYRRLRPAGNLVRERKHAASCHRCSLWLRRSRNHLRLTDERIPCRTKNGLGMEGIVGQVGHCRIMVRLSVGNRS